MKRRHFVASLVVTVQVICATGFASAQIYPGKPVRMVATEAGGASDLAARLVAQGLTRNFGQQVIVDNRGGSIIIPAQFVAKAPPDGYTLLFFTDSIWVLPFLQDNVPVDPLRDFSPIILVGSAPTLVVVHPSLPVTSVQELIALVKAKPGVLNYSSGAGGGVNHLAPELFKAMAGVNITRIPYKGAAPALNSVVAGESQLMFTPVSSGMPHVKSGKLRALAVTSAQPTSLAPGLPTVSASGVPGYEAALLLTVMAPAKTPAALINRLNAEVGRVINEPEVKEKFLASGFEIIGSTPEQLAAIMKTNIAKWGKVIKDAGIRGD
jgi:tripartite-type tricarboxylate transporter receptor subunit TctC